MTQTTGLLKIGADIAAQAAVSQFKTLGATIAQDSPLRPFFTSPLTTWIDDQIKNGKSLDLVGAYRTARLEADGKAQANARLVVERDHLRGRLDDVAGRLLALENGKHLGIIRVKDGTTTYLLEERDSEIASDMNAAAWRGTLTLLSYSAIKDNAAFQRVVEMLFRSGFDGRIVGKPLLLHGVSVKRFTSKSEQEAHGMATALVRIDYTAVRVASVGRVKEIDGGFEIVAAAI